MRVFIFTLGLVLFSSGAFAQENKWVLHTAIASYMTLNGSDLAETMYVIGANRGREANPIFAPFSNRPILFGAAKIGIDTAVSYALIKYHERHPKLALAGAILGIVVESYVVVHNATLLPKVSK